MSFPAPTAASTSHRATLAYQTAKLSTRTGTAPPAFDHPPPTPARVFAPRRPAECGRNRTPTRVRVLRSAVFADPAALKETLNVGDQDVRKRERLLVANRVRAACVWERSLTPRNSQGRTLSRPHIAAAVASVSYYHRLHFHRSATLACKAARLSTPSGAAPPAFVRSAPAPTRVFTPRGRADFAEIGPRRACSCSICPVSPTPPCRRRSRMYVVWALAIGKGLPGATTVRAGCG